MTRSGAAVAGALCLVLLPGLEVADASSPARAVRTSYYVDCSSGSSGAGTLASPWNSLSAVNARTFGDGDTISFKSGTVCTGTLTPKGSGAAGAPITINSYGTGAKPIIDGNGAAWAVRLLDQTYWTVTGLHVKNPAATTAERTGILVESTTAAEKPGIVLKGLEVSDVAGWGNKTGANAAWFSLSSGIAVRARGTAGVFRGVEITDNSVHDTGGGGIKIQGDPDNRRMHTGVHIAGNTIREVGGDGIVVHASDAPLIERNTALDLGLGKYPFVGGNFAGMWPINAKNPVFQFNVVGRSRPSSFDSTAWDCDGGVMGTCTYQYNYSFGNAGGFFLNCADCTEWGNTTTTMVIRYNIAQDDCRLAAGDDETSPINIYNNTFYCPSQPISAARWPNAQYRNNIFVAPSGSFPSTGTFDSNTYLGGVKAPAGDRNAVTADPKLVAPGSGDELGTDLTGYRLLTGSPALANGAVIGSNGGRDYFGNTVSATKAPNRGAYNGAGVTATALPIRSFYNQVGVTSDTNPTAGAITDSGRSFSGQALEAVGFTRGAVKTVGGVPFTWHPGPYGTPDNVRAAGQKIAVTGSGTKLGFLGFSVNGRTTGSGVITFTDGSTQNYTISLDDWWTTMSTNGGIAAAVPAYHNRHDVAYNDRTTPSAAPATRIWFASVTIPTGKQLATVTLPPSPVAALRMNIFDVRPGN
ncbi:right-handed parallel beta-helix repeat-containing protein [Streptomyces sp. NBC_00435]